MTNELFGNYRVTRKIGEGGMGAVYLAEHVLLGRPAAIKILLRELSHRQDLVARFFNEARAATAVKHPGIVEVYDYGNHTDGSAFIVMEYLDGESLSARLRRTGGLSEGRAIALCRQIAGALGAAHAKGIVHRDLKPDNIFIVRDPDIADGERAKILDFGIAKLTSADQPSAGQKVGMTRTGMVMGTPAYMSPEQCKGAGLVDHRADLYALGCILFEMVCGRTPYVGDGIGELMVHHICSPVPSPSAIRPVSALLDQVIVRALAKEPDERFACAADLVAALAQIAAPISVEVTAPAPTLMASHARAAHPTTLGAAAAAASGPITSPRRRWPWAAAALAVAVAAGGTFALASRAADTPDVARAASVPPAPPLAALPVAIAPAPVLPPPVAPPPAPVAIAPTAKITIKLDSDPIGAEVYRMPQGVRIGSTPLAYAVDPIAGELVLLVKKRGYADQQVIVPADRDDDRTIALVRQASAAPRKPPTAPTKPPPPPTGTLDPFDKLKGARS